MEEGSVYISKEFNNNGSKDVKVCFFGTSWKIFIVIKLTSLELYFHADFYCKHPCLSFMCTIRGIKVISLLLVPF